MPASLISSVLHPRRDLSKFSRDEQTIMCACMCVFTVAAWERPVSFPANQFPSFCSPSPGCRTSASVGAQVNPGVRLDTHQAAFIVSKPQPAIDLSTCSPTLTPCSKRRPLRIFVQKGKLAASVELTLMSRKEKILASLTRDGISDSMVGEARGVISATVYPC